MNKFDELASEEVINKTIDALKANQMDAIVVDTKEEAKEKVLSMIPKGAEVMNMSSVTLEETGLSEEIMESKDYISIKKKLSTMDRKTHGKEMQKFGAVHDVTVGSVHAVTEDGKKFSYYFGTITVAWT